MPSSPMRKSSRDSGKGARYEVLQEKRIGRVLDRLDNKTYQQVQHDIDALAENARPRGTAKIGDNKFRIRSGDWRIIYYVNDRDRIVIISRIRRRDEETYRNI